MICAECGRGKTKVLYSKQEPVYTRRRLECTYCKSRFNTLEVCLTNLDIIRRYIKRQPEGALRNAVLASIENMIPDTLKQEDEEIDSGFDKKKT